MSPVIIMTLVLRKKPERKKREVVDPQMLDGWFISKISKSVESSRLPSTHPNTCARRTVPHQTPYSMLSLSSTHVSANTVLSKSQQCVQSLFATMSNVLDLDVVELWSQTTEGFVLVDVYVNAARFTADDTALISRFHHGELSNRVSRSLAKRATKAKHGFYWLSKKEKRLHPDLKLQTATCFHLPRDNISSDTFIIAFSTKYLRFSHSKLNFMTWMSYSICTAAYSTSLFESDTWPVDDTEAVPREESTVSSKSEHNSPVREVSAHSHALSTGGVDENQASMPRYQYIETHDAYRGPLYGPRPAATCEPLRSPNASSDTLFFSPETMGDVRRESPHSDKTLIMPGKAAERTLTPSLLQAIGSAEVLLGGDVKARGSAVDDTAPPAPPTTTAAAAAVQAPHGPDGLSPLQLPPPPQHLATPIPRPSPTSTYSSQVREQTLNLSPVGGEGGTRRPSATSVVSGQMSWERRSASPSVLVMGVNDKEDIDDGTHDGRRSLGPSEVHMISEDGLKQSVHYGRHGALKYQPGGGFSFDIAALSVKHEMSRNVVIDEFSNLEYVTSGSNSHIFSGVWKNQAVILKMLQNEKNNNPVALSEFEIECELLARIDHPNIIKVLAAGTVPRPFLVLERLKDMTSILELDASDTRPAIFRKRAFDYVEILKLALSLADALHYLHTQVHPDAMIIHRDIKPENVGVSSDGVLKLFDFGLCRVVRKRTSADEAYAMTGNTGSIRYMAPEVVLKKPYTEAVDVFSFAVVVWTLSRNKHPYRGYSANDHMARVVQRGERPKLEASWPKEFRDLLTQCWHQDSTRRPSFDQVRRTLAAMIGSDAPVAARPSSSAALIRRFMGSGKS